MDINGRLIQKLAPQTGTSARGAWSKQEFIIETIETYPRKICVNVFGQDKVAELANFNNGDVLRISVNIESREYNGRWYTDIRAWRITKEAAGTPAAAAPAAAPVAAPAPAGMPAVPPPAADDLSEDVDDLPF